MEEPRPPSSVGGLAPTEESLLMGTGADDRTSPEDRGADTSSSGPPRRDSEARELPSPGSASPDSVSPGSVSTDSVSTDPASPARLPSEREAAPVPAELSPARLRALVDQARGGDPEAFRALIEHHRGVATAKAYATLGEVHLCADALQNAYLKAWQKLGSLRHSDRFSGWFLAIVSRAALDVARRRGRLSGHEQGYGEFPPGEGPSGGFVGGEDALVRRERGDRIREALAALPPEYREVIYLKHVEGRSYREIARMLRTTTKAVESRLFRARQQLGRLLDEPERGGDPK
ncbi:MAG: RNA polymerase sigma factor [Planctomycetota bacterium]